MRSRDRIFLHALAIALGAQAISSRAAAGNDKPEPGDIVSAVQSYRPAAGESQHDSKYYFFNMPGVDFDKARSDIEECRSYAGGVIWFAPIPDRVTGPAAPGSSPSNESTEFVNSVLGVAPGSSHGTPPGGVAGTVAGGVTVAVMSALVLPGLIHEVAVTNLRKCMNFKGYGRYALSKELWEKLNHGDELNIVQMQAKVAEVAMPDAARLDP